MRNKIMTETCMMIVDYVINGVLVNSLKKNALHTVIYAKYVLWTENVPVKITNEKRSWTSSSYFVRRTEKVPKGCPKIFRHKKTI